MAATKQDIIGWLDRGKAQGATHVIVVCDTFDWDDYPVFAHAVKRPGFFVYCLDDLKKPLKN
jgi:hypothetical protein